MKYGIFFFLLLGSTLCLGQSKRLQRKRADVLYNVLQKPSDKKLLETIIAPVPGNIDLNTCYQVLFSSDTLKFVAFCLEPTPRDFATAQKKNQDQTIVFLERADNQFPNTYAYIIKGVKYQGKWFYEKSDATYFWSDNIASGHEFFFNKLQQWDFFKIKSTELNPDFWEVRLFEKIKDPATAEYGSENNYLSSEANNKDYVGLYRIVSIQLQRAKAQEASVLDSAISANKLIPAYERQIKLNRPSFAGYYLLNAKSVLIYPKERSVFLAPVMVMAADKQKSLHYYVTFGNSVEIYEWTYFPPKSLPGTSWHYGSAVVEQLGSITKFNFSFFTLDDWNFWNTYVLKQEHQSYIYLKKLD